MNCHSNCERYISWKKAWDEYRSQKPDNSITLNQRNVRINWQNMRYQRRQQLKKCNGRR